MVTRCTSGHSSLNRSSSAVITSCTRCMVQIVRQRAMATQIDMLAGAANGYLVHVDNLRKFRSRDCAALPESCGPPQCTSSGCSMVAGSLSMWVSTASISGVARRISASSAVTKSCAAQQGQVLVQFHVLLHTQPSMVRLHADNSCTLTLFRAATARTRSKMLSARVSRGTVRMTTSAPGRRAAPLPWLPGPARRYVQRSSGAAVLM